MVPCGRKISGQIWTYPTYIQRLLAYIYGKCFRSCSCSTYTAMHAACVWGWSWPYLFIYCLYTSLCSAQSYSCHLYLNTYSVVYKTKAILPIVRACLNPRSREKERQRIWVGSNAYILACSRIYYLDGKTFELENCMTLMPNTAGIIWNSIDNPFLGMEVFFAKDLISPICKIQFVNRCSAIIWGNECWNKKNKPRVLNSIRKRKVTINAWLCYI